MPILVKDFKWKQTDDIVIIQAPMRKVVPAKADIFISARYVKITYEKFFFEAILCERIVTDLSRCTVTDDEVIFELVKDEARDWPSLEPDLTKKERMELKKQLLEESFKEIQKRAEDASNKRHELQRLAVHKAIETDTEIRNKIENVKNTEKDNALGDLDEWRKSIEKYRAERKRAKKNTGKSESFKTRTGKIEKETENKKEVIAPLRVSQTVEVDFTPREFPTPSRESLLEEETEYLAKQAQACRTAGFVSEDIRPEERNPQFIKAKGDEFMRNKNYLGAISAYSYGIKLSKNFVDFYIRRAEAQLAVGNMNRTINDCSAALDLLKPEVPSNLVERALCTGRRGIALCDLGMKRQGINELIYSLRLMPNAEFMEILDREKKIYAEMLAEEKKIAEEEKQKTEKPKTEDEILNC